MTHSFGGGSQPSVRPPQCPVGCLVVVSASALSAASAVGCRLGPPEEALLSAPLERTGRSLARPAPSAAMACSRPPPPPPPLLLLTGNDPQELLPASCNDRMELTNRVSLGSHELCMIVGTARIVWIARIARALMDRSDRPACLVKVRALQR